MKNNIIKKLDKREYKILTIAVLILLLDMTVASFYNYETIYFYSIKLLYLQIAMQTTLLLTVAYLIHSKRNSKNT